MSTELTKTGRAGGRRRGFTLVELLVVISIIALLASIGLVVAGKAFGTSRRAATASLLQSIGTAIESFRNDFGDYPPLITKLTDYSAGTISAPYAITTPEVWAERARLNGENEIAAMRDAYRDARWMSEWSAPAFLLGAGDLNGDGDMDKDKLALDDGHDGFGMRHPGEFRTWTRVKQDGPNAKLVHQPPTDGRVYGPYLDPGSTEKFIERVPVYYDASTDRIAHDYTPSENQQHLYRFVDSWGNPIRYYRNWRTKDRDTGKASVDFAPVELRSYEGLTRQWEDDMATGDLGIDAAVIRAPYMLLAAGDDPGKYVYEDGGRSLSVSPFGDVVPTASGSGAERFQDTVGSFDAPFNPFTDAGLDENKFMRSMFLRMIETNVRYAP